MAHLIRKISCCVLQQPALVNAFQNSASAMSSDPEDEVFLQEVGTHLLTRVILVTSLRDAVAH